MNESPSSAANQILSDTLHFLESAVSARVNQAIDVATTERKAELDQMAKLMKSRVAHAREIRNRSLRLTRQMLDRLEKVLEHGSTYLPEAVSVDLEAIVEDLESGLEKIQEELENAREPEAF